MYLPAFSRACLELANFPKIAKASVRTISASPSALQYRQMSWRASASCLPKRSSRRAASYSLPVVNLKDQSLSEEIKKIIPINYIVTNSLVPFQILGKTIKIAAKNVVKFKAGADLDGSVN
jgi:hypothetical protein